MRIEGEKEPPVRISPDPVSLCLFVPKQGFPVILFHFRERKFFRVSHLQMIFPDHRVQFCLHGLVLFGVHVLVVHAVSIPVMMQVSARITQGILRHFPGFDETADLFFAQGTCDVPVAALIVHHHRIEGEIADIERIGFSCGIDQAGKKRKMHVQIFGKTGPAAVAWQQVLVHGQILQHGDVFQGIFAKGNGVVRKRDQHHIHGVVTAGIGGDARMGRAIPFNQICHPAGGTADAVDPRFDFHGTCAALALNFQ